MTGRIQSSSEGASALASTIKESMRGYLDFSLNSISSSATVSGSTDHDNLSNGISSSLSAWEALIDSDATALVTNATILEGVDGTIAQKLMGVGGE